MLALVSISVYFVLNLLVTITNRVIITQTSTPYLLTGSHASASYFSTTILTHFRIFPQTPSSQVQHTRLKLILFSLLFTANITLSNYTLNLVSLPVHQTVRATAPALTIAICVLLGLRSWSSYTTSTYLSLIPVVFGVILATHGGSYNASLFGLALTFFGAVAAVLKTTATNVLQTHLGMSSVELIRHTAPLAVLQSLGIACYHGEFTDITQLPRSNNFASQEEGKHASLRSLLCLMMVNSVLAAALNLGSFEANRRCGPVSMGIAANLKQVVILFIPLLTRSGRNTVSWQVISGGLTTVAGGIWYSFAQAGNRPRAIEASVDVEADQGLVGKEKQVGLI